jgi:predicted ATPase/DNA-binding winged helix-turn-helix (wHTH) protein
MRSARFGSFQLDLSTGELRQQNRQLQLQNQPFQILVLLLESAGELVTRNEIREKLWSTNTVVDFEHSIGTALKKLRQALGDDAANPRYIETLSRRGYRWLVPVEWEHMPAAASVMGRTGFQPSERSADSFRAPPLSERSSPVRLVGRDQELDKLKACLERMLSGQRQIVFVTGEPGIGKTALVDEFALEATREVARMYMVRGQCVEGYGGKEAYYPILEALGQLCQGSDGDSITQILATQAPTWLVQFPALVSSNQREMLRREILGSTRERMLREIGEALETMTSQKPLLLALEDLQWVDPSTVDLISALARRRAPSKLMLIGTYRRADVALAEHPLKAVKQDLLVHHLCREIALEPLWEAEVAEYLAVEAAGLTGREGLAGLIYRHTEGNPLFMVAVLDHMRDRGLIAVENASWQIKVPLERIDLEAPESLREMIELQIERLSEEEQRVLAVASVAGSLFTTAVGATAANIDLESFENLCEALARRHQIVRSAGSQEFPDGTTSARYEFVHALYREVLYNRQSPGRRAKVHLQVGTRLEELYARQPAEVAPAMAHHFEQGGDWPRAIKYLQLAADTAGRRFEPRQAADILQHALELVKKLADADRADHETTILERLAKIYVAWIRKATGK